MGREWRPEILLYADDWLSIAGREAEIVHTGVNILILWSLGVPFKWKKFRGGYSGNWIGYWFDMETYHLGIAPSRSAWLADWMRDRVACGTVDAYEFCAVVGSMGLQWGRWSTSGHSWPRCMLGRRPWEGKAS